MKVVVDGFPNYAVDDRGNVYNIKFGRMLCQRKHKKGYMYVCLRNKDGGKCFRVHRLVAAAFIPNPHNYDQVNHINEDKTDNRAENLEWCNSKYNNNYGSHVQNISKKVLCVETGKIYTSVTSAHKETGVCLASISAACRGDRKTGGKLHWKYI